MDFSSAFNTIIPDLLLDKLTQLSVPTSICQWIISFLTDRHQLVRLGKLTSRTLTISNGAPQGFVLSPQLFSLYTNDCTSQDPSVKLLKFCGWHYSHRPHQGRRRVCLQTGGWAASCLVQSQQLGAQHAQNSGDDSRLQEEHPCTPPLTIMDSTVAAVESFSSRVIQVPGHHHLPGPEVGQSHWLYCEKGPADVVFPQPAKEVQPATGVAETVLLCHHRVSPVFIFNCLVLLSN